jgi:hypothetical protein
MRIRNGSLEQMTSGVRVINGNDPVVMGDPWSLGSIGKPICSTIIGKLIEIGKLRWDLALGEVPAKLRLASAPAAQRTRLSFFSDGLLMLGNGLRLYGWRRFGCEKQIRPFLKIVVCFCCLEQNSTGWGGNDPELFHRAGEVGDLHPGGRRAWRAVNLPAASGPR